MFSVFGLTMVEQNQNKKTMDIFGEQDWKLGAKN